MILLGLVKLIVQKKLVLHMAAATKCALGWSQKLETPSGSPTWGHLLLPSQLHEKSRSTEPELIWSARVSSSSLFCCTVSQTSQVFVSGVSGLDHSLAPEWFFHTFMITYMAFTISGIPFINMILIMSTHPWSYPEIGLKYFVIGVGDWYLEEKEPAVGDSEGR